MFKSLLTHYKTSLFEVDDKKLTRGAKAALFVFVLIIFMIVGSGVSIQISYINSPSENFGYQCINSIKKSKEIEKFQNRDVKKDLYGSHFTYKYWEITDFKYDHHFNSEYDILRQYGKDPLCQQLGTHFLDVANDSAYRERLIEYKAVRKSLSTMKSQVSKKEQEYSNMLLEDIAHQPKNRSILSSSSDHVKQELMKLQNNIDRLQKRLETLNSLNDLSSFTHFSAFIKEKGAEILERHVRALRYYKFHYTLNIFLFLFPTWLLFYIAYRLFKRNSRFILAYLSVHVANVTALYIIFYLLSFIYEIIPKIFLTKLIALLSSYNLTIVLNVSAIILFMLIFALFIYRIQKNSAKDLSAQSTKIFKRQQYQWISAGLCSECGLKVKKEDIYCGRCRKSLKKVCQKCQKESESDDLYCRHCGESMSK